MTKDLKLKTALVYYLHVEENLMKNINNFNEDRSFSPGIIPRNGLNPKLLIGN